MMALDRNHPAFARLPKRLTISFPIWGLYDIEGRGCYADLDRMVREHVERGFNCIRLDDGAGLMHDLSGKPLGAVSLGNAFGKYDEMLRQFGAIGGEGKCDLLKRLIVLAEAAKRHGVYLILSSWYYLHTYWFVRDESLNDRLFAIPPTDRFMAFAKFLHDILVELETRGLSDCIAFAEIFNEADGLRFINGYGGENGLSDGEIAAFREKHEEAIAYLQAAHPNTLFAYDSYTPWSDPRQIPNNLQIFNFHNYYLWGVYGVIGKHPEFFQGATTAEEVAVTREGMIPATSDWYQRAAVYDNLDKRKFPEMEAALEQTLTENWEKYRTAFEEGLANVEKLRAAFPEAPIVVGEGVSYIASKELVWEEKSDAYWRFVEMANRRYRELGYWGTVVRTCCGPEDPAWQMAKEKLLHVNRLFLEG